MFRLDVRKTMKCLSILFKRMIKRIAHFFKFARFNFSCQLGPMFRQQRRNDEHEGPNDQELHETKTSHGSCNDKG